MEAEEEPFDRIFTKFRVALKSYAVRIRYVKLIEEKEILKRDVPKVLANLSGTVKIVLG